MKYRRVPSALWSRPWFSVLPHDVRGLYLWALTNPHIDRAGVICVLDGVVASEVGITPKRIGEALEALAGRIHTPCPCVYVVDQWAAIDTDNPNMAEAAVACILEHEPVVRAAWLVANEAQFGRRGFFGCDAVRDSLVGVELPVPLPPPAPLATTEDPYAAAIADILVYWREKCGYPDAKPTRDREARIRARLREGTSVEKAKLAIDGCVLRGPIDGTVYDGIDTIFRNAGRVDQLVKIAAGKAEGPAKRRTKSVLWPETNEPDPVEEPHGSP